MEKDKLNFGCENDIRKGWTNVDINKGKDVDFSFDFDKFPYPLKTDSYNYILLKQVLEHCVYPERVMGELIRISKKDAVIEIHTPYANSRSDQGNLGHISHFNRWTFRQFSEKNPNLTLIEENFISQRFLKFIPKFILNLLSTFFNNIYVEIRVKYKVKK